MLAPRFLEWYLFAWSYCQQLYCSVLESYSVAQLLEVFLHLKFQNLSFVRGLFSQKHQPIVAFYTDWNHSFGNMRRRLDLAGRGRKLWVHLRMFRHCRLRNGSNVRRTSLLPINPSTNGKEQVFVRSSNVGYSFLALPYHCSAVQRYNIEIHFMSYYFKEMILF